MKTFTILVVGVAAAGLTMPAAACDPRTRAMAEEAHALAAELVNVSQPYASSNAVWACLNRNAVRADLAAEAVLAGLDCGDYCAARDAAEQLHALAEDMEDDAEDLDFHSGRWRGPHRHAHSGLAPLAARFDDVVSDLCRAVRRLDEQADAGPAPGGGFLYDSSGSYGPSVPKAGPGTIPPAPGTIYEDSWPRRTPGGFSGSYNNGSFSRNVPTPPARTYGPAPAIDPSAGPLLPGAYGNGYGPSARRTLPPGQAKKVDRRAASAQLLIQALAD